MFTNRFEAGRLLAEKLKEYRGKEAVILAVPRGGLPLGAILADSLALPLEVVLIKKIGHPLNKEYAIGAASLTHIILDKQAADISMEYITTEIQKLREVLLARQKKFYKNRKPRKLKDKIAIIVDDGIATGNTILATAQLVHEESPAKIVVAVPVAPNSSIMKLESSAFIDDVICLEQPLSFHGVAQFYENFEQVEDKEAVELFERFNKAQ